MKCGKWGTETSKANGESVHPVVISIRDTYEKENDSDDWSFPLV
jgi:hypothetical protein